MRVKMSKRKNKQIQTIIGIISILILLGLALWGANTDVLNRFSNIMGLNIVFEDEPKETTSTPIEFAVDDNLRVYFIDVGQADSILVMNENEAMLIDAGNNEDGEEVVNFIREKGIEKLNYVIRNSST